jgi:glycosyltransferase involved in cell wall biosynthesis
MRKVLYIGEYYEDSYRGEEARNIIRALRLTDYDIVVRPIIKELKVSKLNEFYDLENKNINDTEVIIQDVVPKDYDYNGHCFNILLYKGKNNMGAVYAQPSVNQIVLSNLYPVNEEVVKDITPISNLPLCDDDFVFYWFGSLDKLDGLDLVLKAFHSVFTHRDNAQLVINCVASDNPQESASVVNDFCQRVKRSMGRFPKLEDYKSEIVIPIKLSLPQRVGLHNKGHCLISINHTDNYNNEWLIAGLKNKWVLSMHEAFDNLQTDDTIQDPYYVDGELYFRPLISSDAIADEMFEIYKDRDPTRYRLNPQKSNQYNYKSRAIANLLTEKIENNLQWHTK